MVYQDVLDRDSIDKKDQWNTEALFSSITDWNKEFELIKQSKKTALLDGSGKKDLSNPENLKAVIEQFLAILRKLDALYTYAHLKHDEDNTNSIYFEAYQRAVILYTEFEQETSWIKPAILEMTNDAIDNIKKSELLAEYRLFLDKIIRLKPHTRSAEEELILASASNVFAAIGKTFSFLNDSEIPFEPVLDSSSKSVPMSHGLYGLIMQQEDRELRKNAYFSMFKRCDNYKQSLAGLLCGKLNEHNFYAKSKHYNSCLESALFTNNIPVSVYHNLIKTVRNNLDLVHSNVRIRKQVLKLDEIHLYDMRAPFPKSVNINIEFDDAINDVIQSLSPLGKDYTNILETGLRQNGWVDRYENKNKRSGAYSSGCYDSFPYILMNYKGTLRDVSTLTHEVGHSMHSYLSDKNQSYQDAQYPIFLAEIASTLNEALLTDYLQNKAKSDEELLTIVSKQLEDCFATLFRQTMFAEFELKIHEIVEAGEAIHPQLLSSIYMSLVKDYFGPDMTYDDITGVEWAYIPHFYYNFYVYQYATGISAAFCFAKKILNKEEGIVKKYLQFISSGGSGYPIDLLRTAGIDMTTTAPLEEAISLIRSQMAVFERLAL